MKKHTPFRYDYVGSFLRPDYLKEAREAYEAGKIGPEQLKTEEDRAISELIGKIKKAGYQVITDGEFRRSSWHLDFMWAFEGVEHRKTRQGIPFHDEPAMIDDTFLVGKIDIKEHPFVEHFRFVKAFEDDQTLAKQTIPSPAQFFFQMITPDNLEQTRKIYPDEEDLIKDLVKAYRKVIGQLYAAGCRNLQLDDCTWGVCVDPKACQILATDEAGLKAFIKKLVRINNLVLENNPEDLYINTHICRGNFHSTWACEGSYDAVAEDVFPHEAVKAFYLEFDDARSGGFEPLRFVNNEKRVVLGLVTSKKPQLESKENLKRRIMEAARFIPLERLSLSPQCGFASTEEGNKLSEEEQWAKLALVRELALEIWGA